MEKTTSLQKEHEKLMKVVQANDHGSHIPISVRISVSQLELVRHYCHTSRMLFSASMSPEGKRNLSFTNRSTCVKHELGGLVLMDCMLFVVPRPGNAS